MCNSNPVVLLSCELIKGVEVMITIIISVHFFTPGEKQKFFFSVLHAEYFVL